MSHRKGHLSICGVDDSGYTSVSLCWCRETVTCWCRRLQPNLTWPIITSSIGLPRVWETEPQSDLVTMFSFEIFVCRTNSKMPNTARNTYYVLFFFASLIQHCLISIVRLITIKTEHPVVANYGSILSDYFIILCMTSRDLISSTTWNRNFRSISM